MCVCVLCQVPPLGRQHKLLHVTAEGLSGFVTGTQKRTHTHTHSFGRHPEGDVGVSEVSVYLCIFICVCVCVVQDGSRSSKGSSRTALLLPRRNGDRRKNDLQTNTLDKQDDLPGGSRESYLNLTRVTHTSLVHSTQRLS